MSTCPECVQGKHDNCDGTAFDLDQDAVSVCACALGWHGKPVVTTTATAATGTITLIAEPDDAPESLRDTEAFCTSKDPHTAILAAHDSERRRALAERDELRAKVARVEALARQRDVFYPPKFGRTPSENYVMGYQSALRDLRAALADPAPVAPARHDDTPPPSGEAECCASGSCEVCRPGRGGWLGYTQDGARRPSCGYPIDEPVQVTTASLTTPEPATWIAGLCGLPRGHAGRHTQDGAR